MPTGPSTGKEVKGNLIIVEKLSNYSRTNKTTKRGKHVGEKECFEVMVWLILKNLFPICSKKDLHFVSKIDH